MIKLILILTVFGLITAQTFYDAFDGHTVSDSELLQHEIDNTTIWCLNPVSLPCDPKEGRRVDGSCNNLRYPVKGMGKQKQYRILPAVFGEGMNSKLTEAGTSEKRARVGKDSLYSIVLPPLARFPGSAASVCGIFNTKNISRTLNRGWYQPRLAKSGSSLPPGRHLRTALLPEGSVPDKHFTHMLANYLVLTITDIASVQDSVNYVIWKTKCCTPEDKLDPIYAPNPVPADDPVFRFSGHNCTNMTRPISFQTQGCVKNNTTPERINAATPVFDLSMIYGSSVSTNEAKSRTFKNGLIMTETDEYGRIWPPTYDGNGLCIQNNAPKEKKCFLLPDDVLNTISGLSITGIWFWRQHNAIAKELVKQNPKWDDDKLFNNARDINTAIYLQVFLFELLPSFVGYNNLRNASLISDNTGFRDVYDKNAYPQVILEYSGVMRWVHTIQEGIIKLHHSNGTIYDEMPLVNLTLRPAYMMKKGNVEGMTQGFFRQAGGSVDYVVDPDIVSRGFGAMQQVLDLCTNDLMKHRYFGFQPYVKYLEHFSGKSYKKFEDLLEVIDEERVEALRNNYNDIEDIDLMAGLWLEKRINGGYVPITLFNILATQLTMSIRSDRHWYENSKRPNAFTYDQLQEIRKASLAMVMCQNADSVTEIQAQAFLKISEDNPLVSCDDIHKIDFSVWKEE